MLPPSSGVPGYRDADTLHFWRRYREVAPPLLRLGFRAALWVLFAHCLIRHRSTPGRISPSQRAQLLADHADRDLYAARQLILVIKLVATLAAFTDPRIRKAASR